MAFQLLIREMCANEAQNYFFEVNIDPPPDMQWSAVPGRMSQPAFEATTLALALYYGARQHGPVRSNIDSLLRTRTLHTRGRDQKIDPPTRRAGIILCSNRYSLYSSHLSVVTREYQ